MTVDANKLVDGTTVHVGDLVLIGQALLDLAAASELMRHASPAGTLDYAELSETLPYQVVRDYTRWVELGPDHERKAARERLLTFLHQSGWTQRVLARA